MATAHPPTGGPLIFAAYTNRSAGSVPRDKPPRSSCAGWSAKSRWTPNSAETATRLHQAQKKTM